MKEKKVTILPGLRVSEELAHKIEKTINTLEEHGYNVPSLRRKIWADLAQIVEKGELPAVPARIMTIRDAEIISAYKVPTDRLEEYYKALDYFNIKRPTMVKAVIEAVIKAAEAKDHLLMPLQLRVAREWTCPHCHEKFENKDAPSRIIREQKDGRAKR